MKNEIKLGQTLRPGKYLIGNYYDDESLTYHINTNLVFDVDFKIDCYLEENLLYIYKIKEGELKSVESFLEDTSLWYRILEIKSNVKFDIEGDVMTLGDYGFIIQDDSFDMSDFIGEDDFMSND